MWGIGLLLQCRLVGDIVSSKVVDLMDRFTSCHNLHSGRLLCMFSVTMKLMASAH